MVFSRNKIGRSFGLLPASFSVQLALFIFMMVLTATHVRANDLNKPEPPYSVKQLRAWHKSMESTWPWLGQPEHKLHLRDQKNYELLLAIAGYARIL
jgi:hypothetical protein